MFGHLASAVGNKLVAELTHGDQQHPGAGGGSLLSNVASSLLREFTGYGQQSDMSNTGSSSAMHVPGEGQVMLSDCNGNKKALLIGINYVGQEAELKGCFNDIQNMRQMITSVYKIPEQNIVTLTDVQKDPNYMVIIVVFFWNIMHISSQHDRILRMRLNG